MEEVKRSNNGIFIVIIIVLLAVIAGLLFMILNNDNKEEKTNNNEEIVETEKEEVEKVDQKLVNKLMDVFSYGSCGYGFRFIGSNDEDPYILYDELSKDYKYEIVLNQIDGEEFDDYVLKYIGKNLDDKYYELFGYDKQIELKNVSKANAYDEQYKILAQSRILYYENGNYYGVGASGCGTGGGFETVYKIIDANKNNDLLEITFKFARLYGASYDKHIDVHNGGTNNIIDKVDCNNNDNSLCTILSPGEHSNLTELVMSKYSDKLNNYKFTFKYDKEHDNYYFYSLERLK